MPGAAQNVGVGAIAGNVTDASGAVLPGATVTLSSPQRTVGANQQTISPTSAAPISFCGCRQARTSSRARCRGFGRSSCATSSSTRMRPRAPTCGSRSAAMAEGVTVTGEAPLLDTTSALKQTVITRKELEALPNRVDIWSVTRVMPSVIMNKVDVGGSQMFLQSQATTRGTTTESGYFIDGLDVSGQDGNGGNAVLYIDPVRLSGEHVSVRRRGPGERRTKAACSTT